MSILCWNGGEFDPYRLRPSTHATNHQVAAKSHRFCPMKHTTNIHRQRIIILVAALLGILGCFIPLGRVPLIWSLNGIQLARRIMFGVFGLTLALTMLGRRDKEMWLPVEVLSVVTTVLVVSFCVFRFIVLGSRSMPLFEDDDPHAGVYYRKACDADNMQACSLLGGCYCG